MMDEQITLKRHREFVQRGKAYFTTGAMFDAKRMGACEYRVEGLPGDWVVSIKIHVGVDPLVLGNCKSLRECRDLIAADQKEVA